MMRTAGIRKRLQKQGIILGTVIISMWLIEIIDSLFFKGALDGYGIQPRTFGGLQAVLIAPWLHASFGHLIANTLPFLVLGWFVILRRTSDFYVVAVIAALVSGLGIWLFGGDHTVHIGASGVIFGFLGYLLARGFFERSRSAIGLAVVALFLYGGMLWGILPSQDGISWQGHLFGFLGGWLVAYFIVRRPQQRLNSLAKRQ